MSTEFIEWAAFAVGTIGTIAWAIGIKYKGRAVEGWFWLASALLWIWFAVLSGHKALAARDILGVALYATGIVNSFRKSKVMTIDSLIGEVNGCDICKQASREGPGSRALAMREACMAGRQVSGNTHCHFSKCRP